MIQAWHWVLFGIILILGELLIPSFTLIWFGCGALLTGGSLYIVHTLSLTTQLSLWTLSSIILTISWFIWIRPKMKTKTLSGLSKERIIGERGMIIQLPSAATPKGKVRFPVPILGESEWDFIIDPNHDSSTFALHDSAIVSDISGNTLIITKA